MTKVLKNQMTLRPFLPGELERDVGVDAAAQGAGPVWMQQAEACIHAVAKRKDYLTTDDVWREIEQRVGRGVMPAVRERRALGAAMVSAGRQGVITPTSSFKQSVRASCHRRPLRVWKSLLGTASVS